MYKNILNYISYIIKGVTLVIWIYLYYIGSLTLNRIFIFIIVFLLIISYSRGAGLIVDIFQNKKIIKYIQNNEKRFYKIFYVLLEIHRWINPFLVYLLYTDKWLYKINRYITGTKYIHYNFIVYILLKYLVMFGLVKLIIHKYYDLWYKLDNLTIVEILFKRMFGLILSILIFTDILNNVISVLSQYSIWIYVIIYYVLSILCVMWELLHFYYIEKHILSLLNSNIVQKFKNLKILVIYKYFVAGLLYITSLFSEYLQKYTKMNIIIFLRSQFTWLGQIITCILKILIPKKNNLEESFFSVTKFEDKKFLIGGRIAYYKPLDNYISFKYVDYFMDFFSFEIFKSTFELYWNSYKINLSYNKFFKPISEIKEKPSIFLYVQLQELAKLSDYENQPINRFMNWKYFELKYKEYYEKINKEECLIVIRNLKYLNEVDELRARLMYFLIWDIEYYYNYYDWNYWIIQMDTMGEELNFQPNDNITFVNPILSKNLIITNKYMFNNKNKLKFYDPEENMEFLNRLFDVLGVLDVENNLLVFEQNKYYVSNKFINYNKSYEELLIIMYTHDYKRWEEPQCECSYVSNYEVEISYKTEEYFYNLRKEWEVNITKEPLEDLMIKDF